MLAALSLTLAVVSNGQIVFQVTAAKDGSVWCATDKGAVHIDADGSARTYDKSSGLNDDRVMQVILDTDGTPWFLHSGAYTSGRSQTFFANGVSHLKKDRTVEILTYSKGLPSGFVFAMVFLPDGTKWFATNLGAVRRKADGTFEVFGADKGLPSSDVRTIFVDPSGATWFGTDAGLAKMDRQGKITTAYPKP
jgi:ligand-binding sensor domain-containing protein